MKTHRKQLTAFLVAALLALVGAACTSYPPVSAPPDLGIHCLAVQDQTLVAVGFAEWQEHKYHEGYVSRDGGVSWSEKTYLSKGLPECNPLGTSWLVSDPADLNVRYLAVPEVAILRSADGGQSWTTEFDLSRLSTEAQMNYYGRGGWPTDDGYTGGPGPFDAVFHEPTHTFVLAMGWDGVLVRTPDGIWHWAAVGTNDAGNIRTRVLKQIVWDIYLAVLLVFLGIGALSLVIRDPWRAGVGRCVYNLAVCWVVWGLGIPLSIPDGGAFSLVLIVPIGIILSCLFFLRLLGVFTSLEDIPPDKVLDSSGKTAIFLQMMVSSAVLAGLFILPYVLWTQGMLPSHVLARVLSTFVGALGFAGMYAWFVWRARHKTQTRARTRSNAPTLSSDAP
ncbi:MAG: hypothetical protein FJ317_02295 [SAR202 cluster bacterium]|nr:hypothetical protein [SAR202 cluster bacterium]